MEVIIEEYLRPELQWWLTRFVNLQMKGYRIPKGKRLVVGIGHQDDCDEILLNTCLCEKLQLVFVAMDNEAHSMLTSMGNVEQVVVEIPEGTGD